MKNILLVINDMVLPNKGGGAPRVYAVARSFKRKGYNPVVFCPLGITEEEAFKQSGIKFVKMKHINRQDPKKILKYGLYNPFLLLRILMLTKKYDIDMIFVHNAICGFPSSIVSRVVGIPVVFDPTDFVAEFAKDSVNSFIKKKVFSIVGLFEKWTIKDADKVISNTNYIKNHLDSKYNKNIDIVYDGVDLSVFYPSRKRKDNKFVAVLQGGMDPQDGLDIVIPCVEKVIKQIPNFELWLVGDGKILPILKEEIKKRNLEKHFKFTGWVTQDQVRQYMSDADIGLVILPNKLSGKIRITLRTMEYWACGLPIIAPDLTSMHEVCFEKENALFYEVENPDSLADQILTLHKDKKLYSRLKKRSIIEARKFDDNVLADKITGMCIKEFF